MFQMYDKIKFVHDIVFAVFTTSILIPNGAFGELHSSIGLNNRIFLIDNMNVSLL